MVTGNISCTKRWRRLCVSRFDVKHDRRPCINRWNPGHAYLVAVDEYLLLYLRLRLDSATRILSHYPFLFLIILQSTLYALISFLDAFFLWSIPSFPIFLYSYFIHPLDYMYTIFLPRTQPNHLDLFSLIFSYTFVLNSIQPNHTTHRP